MAKVDSQAAYFDLLVQLSYPSFPSKKIDTNPYENTIIMNACM